MSEERKIGGYSQDEFSPEQVASMVPNLAVGKYELDVGPKGIKVLRVSRRWIQKEELSAEQHYRARSSAAPTVDD